MSFSFKLPAQSNKPSINWNGGSIKFPHKYDIILFPYHFLPQLQRPHNSHTLLRLPINLSGLDTEMGAGREVSISLDNVRDKNMMQLRKINTALFPIRYNHKYYSDALASGDFTKLGSFSFLGFPYIFSFHI